MRVLLASVYADNSWDLYPFQREFIAATTPGATHLIVSRTKPPFACDWLHAPQMGRRRLGAEQHAIGLRAITAYVVGRQQDFDLAVLCDSDAFPVRGDWAQTIMRCLTRGADPKSQGDVTYVAPMRPEAMEMFPHVSFLAFLPQFAGALRPHMIRSHGSTIFGTRLRGPGAGLPVTQCFPLLKSNVWSPHPLVHSIYGDLVYHRAIGSPGRKWMRGPRYWSQLIAIPEPPQVKTPEEMVGLINGLVGASRFVFQAGHVKLKT